MSIMAFLGGILIGGLLGAMGMFFLIKETAMDRAIEISEMVKIIDVSDKPQKPYCKVMIAGEEIEDPCEAEELPMPEEVKYGNF